MVRILLLYRNCLLEQQSQQLVDSCVKYISLILYPCLFLRPPCPVLGLLASGVQCEQVRYLPQSTNVPDNIYSNVVRLMRVHERDM
jgi:hypothetical protein